MAFETQGVSPRILVFGSPNAAAKAGTQYSRQNSPKQANKQGDETFLGLFIELYRHLGGKALGFGLGRRAICDKNGYWQVAALRCEV